MTAAIVRAVGATNALLLALIGVVYLVWAEQPAGTAVAIGLWALALTVLLLLRRLREPG
ncbi:MAG: hypothetical protein ACKO91_03855 [Acidimicrobiales bacterium]